MVAEKLELACQIIENEAKANCPTDDGILRASITHSVEVTGNKAVGSVGSNAEYAPYIPEGTGLYAKDGHGRQAVPWSYQDTEGNWHSTKGQHPNPFLQQAIDDKKDEILEVFEGMLNDD